MEIILIFIGISCGIMVGAGVISILILVGIVPRMAQISNTKKYISFYERLLIIGSIIGSLISIQNFTFKIGLGGVIFIGVCYGVFVGFLSSGLTEVLEYIPTVSRRLNISYSYLKYLIISLIFGKVIGSFITWSMIGG